MNSNELCKWLRENSSGIYRPAADAADEIERLRAALGAVHWRVSRSDTAFDDIAAAVLADVCEQACPELRDLGPNVGIQRAGTAPLE